MSEASNIETRILEMKLDNDQFEKGVQATIKSLEDLEEKLELKDADSGFEKVASAANTLQFSNMERSLDVLTDKFSLLGNIGLQALTRISNKIVDMGEQLVKGIALDPLMDGWKEFEMKTMSTQTIFGGIRNQFENTTEGRAQAFRQIGNELDRLNEYADQTIYNFAQMTENIGKFTNQGIGLGTATDAIKGIGNWAAMVGADTQQMSRAMYNISQSLGSGAMKLIDWKSIRFANMATPDVQKLFADIAMARGGLLDKKGRPYKQGSKQAAQAYNAILKDFEGSLKTGWLTNDIMMDAFRVLSNEMSEADWVALFGDTEKGQELIKTYKEMGEYAAEAATKVKTFSQLVGVLQESLGSGWATTWETLFGGFEKQTEFLTAISERIGKFIDKDSKERNKWVKNFTGMSILDEDGNFSGLKGLDVMTGTVLALVDAFLNLWDIVREVGKKLADPFGGRHKGFFFGDEQLQQVGLTAMNVAQIFSDLYYIFTTVNEWFKYAPDDRTLSPYESLISIFSGIGSVVGIAYETFMAFSRFAIRVGMLFMPIVTSILNLFGRLGDVLFSIYGNLAGQHIFDYFFNGLYDAVEPVISAFVELSTLIIDFIAEIFGLNDGMGELAGSGNKLGEPIQKLAGFIKNLFTPLTVVTKLFGGFTKGLTAGFRALRKHVKRDGVDQFTDLLDIVQEFVTAGFGEEAGKNAREWVEKNIVGTLKTMVEWMATSWTTISDFFTNLPDKFNDMITRFKAGFVAFRDYKYDDSLSGLENFKNRLHLLLNAIFGEETGNKLIDDYTKYIEPHIKTIAGAIETAFGEVNRVMKGIARVFQGEYGDLEDPFAVLQQIALNFLDGHDEGFTDPGVITRRLGVMDFFKQLKESYENNIQPYVDPVLKWFGEDLPNAFNTVQRALFGYDEVIENDSIYGGDRSTSPEMKHVGGVFENIWNWINGDGAKMVEDILAFFRRTWRQINAFLFGYDTITNPETLSGEHSPDEDHMHVNGVIDNLRNMFDSVLLWLQNDAPIIIDEIKSFFERTWRNINTLLFGSDRIMNPETLSGEHAEYDDYEHVPGFVDQIRSMIERVEAWFSKDGAELWGKITAKYEEIKTWITGTGNAVSEAVIDFFFGEKNEKTGKRAGGFIQDVIDWYHEHEAEITDVFTTKIPAMFATIRASWAKVHEFLFGSDRITNPETLSGEHSPEEDIEHLPGLIDVFNEKLNGIVLWLQNDAPGILADIERLSRGIWRQINEFLFGRDEITNPETLSGEHAEFADTKHIPGLFESVQNWINTDGAKLWEGVDNFLNGKDIVDAEGKKSHIPGAFETVKNFLDPIWDWIQEKGEKVYDYLTTHHFDEMWADLDQFLFGMRDLNDETGQTRTSEGILTPIVNMLEPVYEFFKTTGNAMKEVISRIDFADVWDKIQRFFMGYSETVENDSIYGGDKMVERHVEGLFDRVANLIERIVTFFESEDWQNIKTSIIDFFEKYIKPVLDFIGNLGSVFFSSFTKEGGWDPEKDLFGNLLGVLSKVGTFASDELPNLLQSMFEGTSIGNLLKVVLPNLFPTDNGEAKEAVKDAAAESSEKMEEVVKIATAAVSGNSGGLLSGLLNAGMSLFISTASAEEFEDEVDKASNEGAAAINSAGNAVSDAADKSKDVSDKFSNEATKANDQFDQNRQNLGDVISDIFEGVSAFFGSALSSLDTLAGVFGAGFVLSNTRSIVEALTGHQKDSFIQDIADLFDAFGGFIQSIALLVGAIAADELLNHSIAELDANGNKVDKLRAVDHAFSLVTGILDRIAIWLVGMGVLSTYTEYKIETAADIKYDANKLNYNADISSVSENIAAFGAGIKAIAEAVELLVGDIFLVLGADWLLNLLPEETFAKANQAEKDGEQATEKATRMSIALDKVFEIVEKLMGAIGSIMKSELWQSLVYGGSGTILSALAYGLTGGTTKNGASSGGIRTRVDSYSSNLMAVGSLIESVAGSIGTIITALTASSLFTDFSNTTDLENKISFIDRIVGILTKLISALSVLVGVMAGEELANALQGLDIQHGLDSIKLGGKELVTEKAQNGKYWKLLGFTAGLGIICLAIASLAELFLEWRLDNASGTVYRAVARISAILHQITSLTTEQQTSANTAVELIGVLIQKMADWGDGGPNALDKSQEFRDAMANCALGFEIMSRGLAEYDATSLIAALGSVGGAMAYLGGDEGLDIEDFQAKASLLQLAGMNLAAMNEGFRSITDEDTVHLGTIKVFMETFQEIAQIFSAISALGNFGSFMSFGTGFDVVPFMDFIKYFDEYGGADSLKRIFTELISALPDDPEVLAKLKSFGDNGGGNIGMFVSGLMSLNKALTEYQQVMSQIGTGAFTEQVNALKMIDELGQSMEATDYVIIKNNRTTGANTRLNLFANDVKLLAGSLDNLLKATVQANGNNYDLKAIQDFLNTVNRLGYVLSNEATGGLYYESGLSNFVTEFSLLQVSFDAFVKSLTTDGFDPADLKVASTFIEDLAKAINEFSPTVQGALSTLKVKAASIDASAPADILSGIGTALPELGVGVHEFYNSIKDDFDFQDIQATDKLDRAVNFINRLSGSAATLDGVKNLKYDLGDLAIDLWNQNGTGLFNALPGLIAAAKEFDTDGLNTATEIMGTIGTFADSLTKLMISENGNGDFSGVDDVIQQMSRSFSDFFYPSLQGMPIGELQAYAQAFGDLSDAMTLGGKTNMLAGAVSETIRAMQDQQVEIHVTPVIDWPDYMVPPELSANLNPDVTGGAVNNSYAQNMSMMVQFPEVQAVHLVGEDMSTLTETIRTSNASTASAVDSAGEKIASLTVQLDTGVLVGQLVPQINRVLGRGFRGPGYIPVYNSEPETED